MKITNENKHLLKLGDVIKIDRIGDGGSSFTQMNSAVILREYRERVNYTTDLHTYTLVDVTPAAERKEPRTKVCYINLYSSNDDLWVGQTHSSLEVAIAHGLSSSRDKLISRRKIVFVEGEFDE